MDNTEKVLSIMGAIAGLLVLAGGAWAILSSASKDAMQKRLKEDNTYLMNQLSYIEPKFRDAEAKNEMLMKLHNPTAKLDAMSTLEVANHVETVRLLGEQREILVAIETKLDEEKS